MENTKQEATSVQKVIFDNLAIEITRRCQLKCAHCMRGDAQDVDMSHETIDRLLDQTESIGTLHFSGGEPTLNIDGMRYFLDGMKNRNITLNKLKIIINGYSVTDEFINLMKDYYDYIEFNADYGRNKICINISCDRYHKSNDGYNPEDTYVLYKNVFDGYTKILVEKYYVGNNARAVGRGKNLEEAIKYSIDLKRIEIISKHSKSLCMARNRYALKNDNQVIVACPIYISVHGILLHAYSSNDEYIRIDSYDFDISKDTILDVIAKHNKEATYCIEVDYIESQNEKKVTLKDLNEMTKTINGMINNPTKYLSNYIHKKKILDSINDGIKYDDNSDEKKIVFNEWLEMKRNRLFGRNEAAKEISREHPEYTAQDCILIANSRRIIKDYHSHNDIVMLHYNKIRDIELKYKNKRGTTGLL